MRAHLIRPITDREGNLLYNATVTVREKDYAIPVNQPLYVGPTGSDELPNPFVASNGVIDFWMDTPQRVSVLVQSEGQSDTLVYLDALPPPEQIVVTDSPLEIVNTPTTSGQVLLSTSTAGQVQWGNPPSGTGLSPVVVVASQSFSSGADPSGWGFTGANGGTHSYDTTVPPGTNYTHSLVLSQTGSNGTVTVTGPTFTLLEAGRVSMWIRTDLAPTETLTIKIVDNASVQTTQATIGQDQDWGFYAFDLAAGTWHSLITYTGQALYDAATSHEVRMTGYVAQYGGLVPPHTHSGTGGNSTALGTAATASATGSTAVGASAVASGPNSTAFGYNAQAAGNTSLAAGYNASAPTDYSIAVGSGATGSGTATAWTAIGQNASAQGLEAVAVGKGATVATDYGVAIGSGAATGASATSGVAVGQNASAQGVSSVAIGKNATVGPTHDNSIAIGAGSTTTSANQLMLGNTGSLTTILGGMQNYGIASLGTSGSRVGFYGSAGNVQQTIGGSDDGNVTLRTLVQALGNMGLINNQSLQQPIPFKSPVGIIDYYYHQDPGDGSLGVADFDFQPYSYFPLAFTSKNPYPSGPQWFVGTDHNGYKGFATGLGVFKNMFTPKQSALFTLTTTGTGNKICLAVRHTGQAGNAAAAGYFILDQAADTIGFYVKNAGDDADVYTQVGSSVGLTGIGSTPFDGSAHSHIINVSGTNVSWMDGGAGMPITWSAPTLNTTGTYIGLDLAQTTTKINNLIFLPQQMWDAFITTGSLSNAPSGEAWWPVLSGTGAAASVTATNNLQLTGAASGYSIAYVLTNNSTGDKFIQMRFAPGTTPTTSMGLIARYVDPNNYYFINSSQIVRVLNGTATTLTTLSSSFAAGDRMQATFNGTTGLIKIQKNVAVVGTAIDTNFMTSPRFGLGVRGAATGNFSYLWCYDGYNPGVVYR